MLTCPLKKYSIHCFKGDHKKLPSEEGPTFGAAKDRRNRLIISMVNHILKNIKSDFTELKNKIILGLMSDCYLYSVVKNRGAY